MKKKLISILTGLTVCLGLCGCNNNTASTSDSALSNNTSSAADGNSADSVVSDGADANSADSAASNGADNNSADSADGAASSGADGASDTGDGDWKYIADKGDFVIGYTIFEPLNYPDENGELTGFETEFAKAVCEKLGVTPKFQEIEWDKKEMELQSRTIDAIWNGLTVNEDRKQQMAFSTSYIKNKQVLVVKAENADKYPDTASMADISIAFENGSAGEDAANADDTLKNCTHNGCSAQKDALMEVKAGTSDACIIDYVMALASVGEGTDYSDLKILEILNSEPEDYAIGMRLEDTETVAKVNGAIDELAKDGTLKTLIDKYGLSDASILV